MIAAGLFSVLMNWKNPQSSLQTQSDIKSKPHTVLCTSSVSDESGQRSVSKMSVSTKSTVILQQSVAFFSFML